MATTKSRKKPIKDDDEVVDDVITTDQEVQLKWVRPTGLIKKLQKIRAGMSYSWYGDEEHPTTDQQTLDQVIGLLKGANDGKRRTRKRA